MAGDVLVNGQVIYKADYPVNTEHQINLKEKFPYVSRGALKIEKALKEFHISVQGFKTLDIGISNGGFTDYMLQQGAIQVVGVDVNIQQVDQGLQRDPRVKLVKANARNLTYDQVGFQPDLITMDVSFISISRILPVLKMFPDTCIVSLIKPQFEALPKDVDKGGIVRDPMKRIETVLRLKDKIVHQGYAVTGFTDSGVKGRKGNQEYFFLIESGKMISINDKIVSDAIKLEL